MDKNGVCKSCEYSATTFPYGDLYCDMHKKMCDTISECNIKQENEEVKNPTHYTSQVLGIECIDVTQHFNFNRGNIIKYAWRCGDKGDAIQDLEKVIQYAKFEIDRIKNS